MEFLSSTHFMLFFFLILPFLSHKKLLFEEESGEINGTHPLQGVVGCSPPPHSPVRLISDLLESFCKSILTNVSLVCP